MGIRVKRNGLRGTTAATFCLAATAAAAQGLTTGGTIASDPNPYYLGISEAIVHDSNVYQVPGGPGDYYSSTSLYGGFDQPIGRQRVFGKASVSYNRYQDQSTLNNTSYDLNAGLDWATIANLSGNINADLNRRLAAPTASVGTPSTSRNVADTQSIDAKARWGGPALLTLEGDVNYSNIDYSAPQYASAESHQEGASLGLYYRPGAFLRVGIAGRATRARAPKAFIDTSTGSYEGNTVDGRYIDLLADYVATGQVTVSGRLSYTTQKNSGVGNADFSGLTGSLSANWQVTGKTSLQFDASREAGFDTNLYNAYPVQDPTLPPPTSPVVGLYENNRVTTTVGLSAAYAATSKISATAGLRYTRANLVTTLSTASASTAGPETTDVLRSANLGANYAINRSWSAGCFFGHDSRELSGGVNYSYSANRVGCSTQYTWR